MRVFALSAIDAFQFTALHHPRLGGLPQAPGCARLVVRSPRGLTGATVERKRLPLIHLLAAGAFALTGLAACAASPPAPAPLDAIRLQSELMAFTDTALARITTETNAGSLDKDPNVRQFSQLARLTLGSSLLAIVSSPDPVDALLDMLTHTALVAEGGRNAASGKAADSPEGKLLRALEQNEADAWKLAERWLEPAARSALRERISSWPGQRLHPVAVAYVRLSDISRTGSASAVQVEGMLDSLRAAVRQAEQARLLGERTLWLAQRMPFVLRWQGEIFVNDMLTMDESRRLLGQIEGITSVADSAVREAAGMPDKLTRKREAALQDLFARIERERKAMLEGVALIVKEERSATLAEAGAFIEAQRVAIFEDLGRAGSSAEKRGLYWAGIALLVGLALVVALLIGALGTALIYRRFIRRTDRRLADHAAASQATR